MNLNTTKFGEIQIDENLIFDFVEPVIGYDNLRKYVLVEHSENSAFRWLQSVEDADLAFPVTSPASFDIDYQFEIPTDKAEKIGLSICLAPIIINAATKQGMQIILSNSNYPVKEPLIKD